MKTHSNGSGIVSRLFFKLLPIQILIVAMGSVNSIVDGVIAGRFIAPSSVGVIGLYYTMVRILEAVGAVLLGGTAVLCGKYMGSGRRPERSYCGSRTTASPSIRKNAPSWSIRRIPTGTSGSAWCTGWPMRWFIKTCWV